MAIRRPRREELEDQLNRGALWAVAYGDLMSYMMIFFLILFSFSIAKTDRTKSRKYEESLGGIQKAFGGKIDPKRLERAAAREKEDILVDRLKESMEKQEMSKFVQIQSTEQKVHLVLTEAILFDSGKAGLKVRAKKVLGAIAAELGKLPNDIVVEGHTDNVPIRSGKYSTNWELSMARAYNVVQFMEKHGIDSQKLAGIGYGEHRPVGDNLTREGRAKNRRIEISLIKTE